MLYRFFLAFFFVKSCRSGCLCSPQLQHGHWYLLSIVYANWEVRYMSWIHVLDSRKDWMKRWLSLLFRKATPKINDPLLVTTSIGYVMASSWTTITRSISQVQRLCMSPQRSEYKAGWAWPLPGKSLGLQEIGFQINLDVSLCVVQLWRQSWPTS